MCVCRPQARFGDYLSLNDDSDSPEPKLILKRAPSDNTSVEKKVQMDFNVNIYKGKIMYR